MSASVVTAGESFSVGKALPLFEGSFRGGMFGISIGGFIFHDYAVALDGQRFVMFVRETPAPQTEFYVVFWSKVKFANRSPFTQLDIFCVVFAVRDIR